MNIIPCHHVSSEWLLAEFTSKIMGSVNRGVGMGVICKSGNLTDLFFGLIYCNFNSMLQQYSRGIILNSARCRPTFSSSSVHNQQAVTQPPHVSVLLNEILELMKPIQMKVIECWYSDPH